MSDIIETIDTLLAEAVKSSSGRSIISHKADLIALALALSDNWPALRDRLVAAERKARAFDAIASGDVELYEIHRPAYWTVETTSDPLCAVSDPDLLTAIEAATREHSS